MTQTINFERAISNTPVALRRAIYALIALNLIVFGFLFLRSALNRFEAPMIPRLLAPNTNGLLLDGLRQQRSRLERILSGPCESPDMDQYLRGQIGPLIRGDIPSQSVPPAQSTEPATGNRTDAVQPTQPEASSPPPTIPPGQSSATEPGPTPATAPTVPQANTPSQPSSALPAQVPGVQRLSGGAMLSPASLRDLVDHSVVRVVAPLGPDQAITGTGFAIGPDTIVTNRHVIAEARDGQLFVTSKFLGAEPVRARILLSTTNSEPGSLDFAVLKIERGNALTPLTVGDDPQPLESVIAAGYPGLTLQTDNNNTIPDVVFSQGDVSVVQPQSSGINLVIHTANISPGSSGGPLINRCGTVVGVNTFVSSGDEYTGRALYSLSGKTLSVFLKGASIPFDKPSATDCAPGAN